MRSIMKREVYKVGDKSRGICGECKKLVSTTFELLDLEAEEEGRILKIENVLTSCCDECKSAVGVPQQEFSKIGKEIREQLNH